MTTDILPAIQAGAKIYLRGPFGSGKTTLALERIRWLLRQERVRGDDILVLTPQRTLAQPYYALLREPTLPPGPPVRITTLAGLAHEAVKLYWPIIAEQAGFHDPRREPSFLNLETSQYHMAPFVDEAIHEGDFNALRLERGRVITQILDNLNKAALNGFTIDDAYHRLELSVPAGEQRAARLHALAAARRISDDFRALCLRASLVDFSLLITLFTQAVLTNPWSRTHLLRSHRHLIFDNVEEGTAAAHHLAAAWLPDLESALLIEDEEGGLRLFLGADPVGARGLAKVCDTTLRLSASHIMPEHLAAFAARINRVLERPAPRAAPTARHDATGNNGMTAPSTDGADLFTEPTESPEEEPFILPPTALRFYPQMITWVANQVAKLVDDEGMSPGSIVILAPYLGDALRFSLQSALDQRGIPTTTHRPSRSLQDEPAARSMLVLAALAHPQWEIRPDPADVATALMLAIDGLDPVRANLLTAVVYPANRRTVEVGRFGAIGGPMQQRISYRLGEAFDRLMEWIGAYRAGDQLEVVDQFLARLFGEVLSQPGFGFHQDADAARVANQLVQSARSFRWALTDNGIHAGTPEPIRLGREYVLLVQSGALGALFAPGWREANDAVLLAPAYTFLMRNRPVDVQFWLDIGSSGWWERLYQPLTHPHVMSPHWPPNIPWGDADEFHARQDTMRRLLLGLIRRTRKRIYLGMSTYGESGSEQRGALLALINRLLLSR